jgi:YfiH family protein
MRQGGFSQPPYDSLNLAEHVGDEQHNVLRNRELLQAGLNLPAGPNWLEQTHSTQVVVLENDASRKADAAITRLAGTVAVVMTADCLPILLCNQAGTEVAAVHAGWRGLADGVIQATLKKLQSPVNELMAWIGPGISQQYFEVGDAVRDIFLVNSDQNQQYFIANRPGHWLCDLPGLATGILGNHAVVEIDAAPDCSYRDEAQFFSYRRSTTTGRMASLIWIESC